MALLATLIVMSVAFADPMKLSQGRTTDDAGRLLAAGIGLRGESIGQVSASDAIATILKTAKLAEDDDRARQLLGFHMRGAIPLLVVNYPLDYIVFLNPVTDTALITVWTTKDDKPQLFDSRIVLGERLEDQQPASQWPRWSTGDISSSLTALVKRYADFTANADKDFLWRLRVWFTSGPSSTEVAMASRRIAMAALATSDKAFPCGEEISQHSTGLGPLVASAKQTNLAVRDAESLKILPVGGVFYPSASLAVRIFGVSNSPSDLVVVAADKKAKCTIESVTAVDTLP